MILSDLILPILPYLLFSFSSIILSFAVCLVYLISVNHALYVIYDIYAIHTNYVIYLVYVVYVIVAIYVIYIVYCLSYLYHLCHLCLPVCRSVHQSIDVTMRSLETMVGNRNDPQMALFQLGEIHIYIYIYIYIHILAIYVCIDLYTYCVHYICFGLFKFLFVIKKISLRIRTRA